MITACPNARECAIFSEKEIKTLLKKTTASKQTQSVGEYKVDLNTSHALNWYGYFER